jgi:hypothetical protein
MDSIINEFIHFIMVAGHPVITERLQPIYYFPCHNALVRALMQCRALQAICEGMVLFPPDHSPTSNTRFRQTVVAS